MKRKYITALLSTLVLIVAPVTDPFVPVVAAAQENAETPNDVLNLEESDWGTLSEQMNTRLYTGGSRNIDVITGYAIEVPNSILKELAGKKTTLALHTGDGIAISLTGTDIRATDRTFRLVLSAEGVIPDSVKQQVLESALAAREFSMPEKERYPFCVNVHVSLGAEYSGKPAMLYCYDEAANTLRLAGIYPITESGHAMFALNRGDEYIAVVREGDAYVVKPGEHLDGIARRNGLKLKSLLAANPHITNANVIYPGQVIILP